MRICQIIEDLPPGKWGGTTVHNFTLIKYLIERGYDVEVIVLWKNYISVNDIKKSVNTINKGIKIYSIFPKPLLVYYDIYKKIKEIEKTGKIDVFDVHTQALILPLNSKQKNILSLHFFEMTCPLPKRENIDGFGYPRPCSPFSLKRCYKCCGILRYLHWKFINRLALRKISKIMVKFDYMKQKLIENGIEENKIVIVPHWIDIETIHQKSNSKFSLNNYKLKKDDFVFCYFGRLDYEKGGSILLEAFLSLSRAIANVKLLIVGHGPLQEELEKYCTTNDIIENVIFTGQISYLHIHSYLSLANAIIFPHRFVNYEWALLEAMCTEKPIIATNVAATTDILIDKYNALLAEPTPESLSLKMKEILENPELAKKIARNAFETVKEKHTMRNLKKYENLINDI